MNEINIITAQHQSTNRNYIERMVNEKIHCMKIASRFDNDYWDGDRKYGYGGYSYDGRWKSIAQKLITRYELDESSKVLDLGCGKAHLLYELTQLLPGIEVIGIDISEHGIGDAPDCVKSKLILQDLRITPYQFTSNQFDLVLSLNTLHNFGIEHLDGSIREIERIGKRHYLCVESFRNESELFNLQCWALTCNSFHSPNSWEWILKNSGYSGDYEFIFFE